MAARRGSSDVIAGTVWYTPPWLRWNPEVDYEMSWGLNVLMGLVAAFGAANLYYTHPILDVLAEEFRVSGERSSLVPTIVQAGYAAGLLFICPIGDIVPRRPLMLLVSGVTAMLWLGCTLTRSFNTFMGLHFAVGMFTVSPQLMFPLAIRYAPAQQRAVMTAIVVSGINFGILVARLLSGIVTEFASWRIVFWVSFGIQIALLVAIFLFVPDFPVLSRGVSYPGQLLKVVRMPFKHPVLVQQALIAFLIMSMFTCFWTTLTFQLAGKFHLSTLVIGLFALVGLSPLLVTPVVSRLFMSRIHPSGILIIVFLFLLVVICIGTFVGDFSIAGPVVWACLGDLGMSLMSVAGRMAFAHVEPMAQNVVNTVYMVFAFSGQLFGTAIGNKLYAEHGWVRSGIFSIGVVAAALLLVFVRGPHETGWIGWRGGWELRASKLKRDGELPPPQGASIVVADQEKTEDATSSSVPSRVELHEVEKMTKDETAIV